MLARPLFDWRLRNRTLQLGTETKVMGIVNVTPDSFSDGGQFATPQAAIDHALRLLDEGAHLLDLGAESTRPNARPVTPEEEQSRLLPVVFGLLKLSPHALLSVDTYHAETAKKAVEAGAEIVNDVSGLLWDAEMALTCAALGCGVILMHTRGSPRDWGAQPAIPRADVLPTVLTGLRHSLHLAQAAGIPGPQIVLDPGFGFGKRGDENYTLLAHLADLHQLNLPFLSGASRKGFLGATLAPFHGNKSAAVEDRLIATQAANVASVLGGAHILRVHDVRAARESAAIADAILHYA